MVYSVAALGLTLRTVEKYGQVFSEAMKEDAKSKFQRSDFMGAAKVRFGFRRVFAAITLSADVVVFFVLFSVLVLIFGSDLTSFVLSK